MPNRGARACPDDPHDFSGTMTGLEGEPITPSSHCNHGIPEADCRTCSPELFDEDD